MDASPLTGHREAPVAETEEPATGVKPRSIPPRPVRRPPRPAAVEQQAPAQPQEQAAPPQELPQLSGMDPAVASMFRQSMNMQRQTAQHFYLVVLPEANWPTCEEFETVELLIERIKVLLGAPCSLFPFIGTKLPIKKGPGPFRFLSTPTGPLPLFDMPEADDAAEAEYGWVGEEFDMPTYDAEGDTEEEESQEAIIAIPDEEESPLPDTPADNTPMFDT